MSAVWRQVNEYGWQSGEYSPVNGDWVRGKYSIGKVFIEGCTLFEVWHDKQLIATVDGFDEARDAARLHAKGVA